MSLIKRIVVWLVATVLAAMMAVQLVWGRWKKGNMFFYVKDRPKSPPILTDDKWGTHRFMRNEGSGIRLHYVEAGDRSRPLMVFVHGFPELWFSWRHQMTYFARTHWVVALDLRGYGDSDKPEGKTNYKVPLLVDDLKCFIEGLGREKCILVAHDWGAVLAWNLVERYPDMFTAHVSCNGPHIEAYKRFLRRSLRQMLKAWYVFFFQVPWLPEIMIRSQDFVIFDQILKLDRHYDPEPYLVREAYKYHFSQKGALTPPINYYRANNILDGSLKTKKVQVPTLVVWGTEDTALETDLAQENAQECNQCKISYIKGAGHFVQQERPEEVNSHIKNFLNQLPT